MYTPNTPSDKIGLDETIDRVLLDLRGFTSETKEYAAAMNQLQKLYAIRAQERPDRVSHDTLVTVAGNLLGIVLIVGYERANIITSKATSLLLKLR